MMKISHTAFRIACLSGLALSASTAVALAQPPLTGESSRGVRILEAEPEPAPAPAPQTTQPAPQAPPVAPRPAVTPPAPPRVLKFCDRPFDKPDLTLASQKSIDKDLAASLKTRKRVVVDLAQPYKDDGQAPAGLAEWLAEVKAGGGEVKVKEYCEAARGNLGTWIAQLFAPRPAPNARAIYQPARLYNVILHADALDKVITQVEFAPKNTTPTSTRPGA